MIKLMLLNMMFNLILLLFASGQTMAHPPVPPNVTWAKGWLNGNCEAHNRAGVQTADGGYFLVGDGQCYDVKTSFERQITAAKVAHNGTLEWYTNVGDIGYNYGKFGLELSDGTLVLAGMYIYIYPSLDE